MKHRIALGVDLGWVSQLEQRGIIWVDDNRNAIDPIQAAKDLGADSVRLRVFVNPPKEAFWEKPNGTTCMLGFCDAQSVLDVAKRVKALDMKLMLDFHYSDHFADPMYQHIPKEWEGKDEDRLTELVYKHTKEVLELFVKEGISPEWVQVGNEINPGILIPVGSMENSPEVLVRFLNAGYEAVKECCPDCMVVTHVAGILLWDICDGFYDRFFACGGKTDALGLSYYPYWYGRIGNGKEMPEEALRPEALRPEIIKLLDRYGKPVLISEIGGPEWEERETYELLADTIRVLKDAAGEQETGIFYWEPEVNSALLPDQYPLGAARLLDEHTLQYTHALAAYHDSKQTEKI